MGKRLRSLARRVSSPARSLLLAALSLHWIGRIVAVPYVILALVLVAVGLVLMLSAQRGLREVAADGRTRVIHGLEHGAIAVLVANGHEVPRGHTDKGTLMIEMQAGTPIHVVRGAIEQAIARIAAGETSLAYSVYCGTSVVTRLLVYCSVTLGIAVGKLLFGVPLAIALLVHAVFELTQRGWADPLGLWAQRMYTVSTTFSSVALGEIIEKPLVEGGNAQYTIAVAVTL